MAARFGQYMEETEEKEHGSSLKPEPVAVETICSVCGIDWGLHGESPTTDDCINLLKSALEYEQSRRVTPIYVERHVAPPIQQPWYPSGPYWYNSPSTTDPRWDVNTITCDSSTWSDGARVRDGNQSLGGFVGGAQYVAPQPGNLIASASSC
jgi:hypothetical protein